MCTNWFVSSATHFDRYFYYEIILDANKNRASHTWWIVTLHGAFIVVGRGHCWHRHRSRYIRSIKIFRVVLFAPSELTSLDFFHVCAGWWKLVGEKNQKKEANGQCCARTTKVDDEKHNHLTRHWFVFHVHRFPCSCLRVYPKRIVKTIRRISLEMVLVEEDVHTHRYA